MKKCDVADCESESVAGALPFMPEFPDAAFCQECADLFNELSAILKNRLQSTAGNGVVSL